MQCHVVRSRPLHVSETGGQQTVPGVQSPSAETGVSGSWKVIKLAKFGVCIRVSQNTLQTPLARSLSTGMGVEAPICRHILIYN